ncbi:MAG: riboflavin synthase [Leifsonia sp.]
MFTGIIEEIGEITAVDWADDAARLTVHAPIAVSDAEHGDSISVSGVCLTVIGQDAESFTADVMAETLAMSTLDGVQPGRRVNLERAARVGDRLGGHIVQGHIDGTATILAITDGSAWRVVRLSLDPEHAPLLARKGSITIDGVSLTVSAVGGGLDEGWFEVSLIPETLTATTLGDHGVGDRVNIETDILARHVERMLGLGYGARESVLPSSLNEPTFIPATERSSS